MKEKEEGTGDSIQSAWFLTLPFQKHYSSEVQDPWPDRLAPLSSKRGKIIPERNSAFKEGLSGKHA